MKPTSCVALKAEWKTDLKAGTFVSPAKDKGPNQVVLFDDQIKDGSIAVSMIPLAGERDSNWNWELRECAIMFRYIDQEHFYFAGIGGFGRKFYIAKVTGSEWRMLEGVGLAGDLNANEVYHLQFDFQGDRFTLVCDDVPILKAIDSSYYSGQCGLRVNNTEARFEDLEITKVPPKCFVIMPFDAELDFVYRVIKDTVERSQMECRRADEKFISQPIIEDVKNEIAGADLIIADFTNRNPNVYFEAGLADAWKKKWIVLAQSTNDLAFDVRHIRTIIYSDKMGADSRLKDRLERALGETMSGME